MDGMAENLRSGRRSLPQALWRFRGLVVACMVVVALLGLGVARLQQPTYEASVELLVTDPRDAGVFKDIGGSSTDATRYVRNQAQRFVSSTVALRASELLDGDIAATQITENVVAEPSTELDLIVLRATWRTAQGAASLAEAVVQAYQDVVLQDIREAAQQSAAELEEARRDLERRIAQADQQLEVNPDSVSAQIERDTLVSQLTSVQGLIERLTVDTALYGSGVEVLEPAAVPEAPASPRPAANAVLGALLGMLIGGSFAAWRAQVAARVESRYDPGAILGAPLLGGVPDMGSTGPEGARPTIDNPRSPDAEAYRFIAAALEYVLAETDASTILVTSAAAGDGKTTTVVNLAVALMQEGRRLAVADVDARVAGLTKMSGLEGEDGVTDLARPGADVIGGLQAWRLGRDASLNVAPIGRRQVDPTQFFRTPAYRQLLAQMDAAFDLVLLDAPPLLAVSETSAAAGGVDGIILVVQRGATVRSLEEVRDRLQFVGAPLIGYIYNRSESRGGDYGRYGYGYVEHGGARRHQESHSNGRRKVRKLTGPSTGAAREPSEGVGPGRGD